jgi:carbamoyl-phosphate synthase small subunit
MKAVYLKVCKMWEIKKTTARLVLANGLVLEGMGLGAQGQANGEVCFNTAMTGYQEILTDPSYSGQIITFTFPHIGNIGVNEEDIETLNMAANTGVRGVVLALNITTPSNYRAVKHLDTWLKTRGIVGICGVDTRALTAYIRDNGMENAVICHEESGEFNLPALQAQAKALPLMDGLDLVPDVTSTQRSSWSQTPWVWNEGFAENTQAKHHIVALDFGVKRNILRLLARKGVKITILPATASGEEVLALKPDGVFLSNGPGDPAATGVYAVPTIQAILAANIPTFGICLGHQMLGLALGGKTVKMHQGHHGANHPVQDLTTKKVEITSMNHGFALDEAALPKGVKQTHISLFDGSNAGIESSNGLAFSVQYHPEASPGPQDSHYLFERFIKLMEKQA